MLEPVLGIFSSDVAVDLGSSHTRVHVRGRGVVCREPSLVAVREQNGGDKCVVGVGGTAREMWGRTPPHIQVIRPVRGGIIADFEATEAMLRFFLRGLHGGRRWRGPRMAICIPYGTTEVERRAVRECGEAAGARRVWLVEEPVAAALGADLDILVPEGNLVVDIGGGTTEIAVLSMGGVVHSHTVPVAGDALDAAIVEHLRSEHHLLVGQRTAERAKVMVGNAISEDLDQAVAVKGRDLRSGYPRGLEVTAAEIHEALAPPLEEIAKAVVSALEHASPELAGDVVDRGLVLTGGGALLRGLDVHFRSRIGLPVVIPDDPLDTVVQGTARALARREGLAALLA